MRRILIVSPHFPPINAPDMQRVRMSLPYYRGTGWEPIVLSVAPEEVDGVREPELLSTIPSDVRVIRAPCLPLRWTRLVGLRNIGLRCWFGFLFTGARLIRREGIDLVFFSNTQFVTFTLGRIWRAWLGTPYVFDMQDPWRTDYYQRAGSRRPPGGWKYQVARLMAWTLEGWSFQRVSGVMSVSPGYLADLRARYSAMEGVPDAVINFGASRHDAAAAMALPDPAVRYVRQPGEIHLVYTGASGPIMPHALTVLFDALRRYRAHQPTKARRLRLHFFGTSYVAPGQGLDTIMPLANACGVGDQVDEVPHRLGHLECLRLQNEADALILPGSSDLAYSPSKIYPYFLSGRPVLGIVFRQSVMEQLLDKLDFAFMVRITGANAGPATEVALFDFFEQALAGFPGRPPGRNQAFFDQHFAAATLATNQAHLFARAIGFSSGNAELTSG